MKKEIETAATEPVKRKRAPNRPKEVIAAEKAAKLARKLAREEAKAKKEKTNHDPDQIEIACDTKAVEEKEETSKVESPKSKSDINRRSSWSTPKNSIDMNHINVEIRLIEPALGTSPSNEQLLTDFIASNAPDAASRQEEIAAYGKEEIERKQTTVFMKGNFVLSENNSRFIDILDKHEGVTGVNGSDLIKLPFFWNYQIRGMFKDACGLLSKSKYGESSKLKAYKKVIDGGIFVHPRRIAIDIPEEYYDLHGNLVAVDVDNLPIYQRPLRISGPTGERSAIASSEMIPEGSSLKFSVSYADPKYRDIIIEWLDYGAEHGLGAWRNSGLGTFIWRELNDEFMPFDDEE